MGGLRPLVLIAKMYILNSYSAWIPYKLSQAIHFTKQQAPMFAATTRQKGNAQF